MSKQLTKAKRIVGLILSFVMVLSLMPITVFAAENTYVVAGVPELCGNGSTGYGWDAADTNNLMTLEGDKYVKVYSDVAVADDYQIKVVVNGSEWQGANDGSESNLYFNVTSVCDVTVTYDPVTTNISVTGDGVVVPSLYVPSSVTAVGAGSGNWLNGVNWGQAEASNHMTQVSTGIWSITYKEVAKTDLSSGGFKFAMNDSWDVSFGGSDLSISSDGTYALSTSGSDIYFNTGSIAYDMVDITLTLDLTSCVASSMLGAVFNIEIKETTYEVTNTLTNITSNGAKSATYKTAYAATLAAEEGYDLPESITVKVGETALTAGTDYTYDSATGVVTILAEKVTGAITITAEAEKEIYTVTNTLTNITSNGAKSATYKTVYTATLTAEEGYDLPESITVKVGETALTAGTDYTYDSATGVVTILAEKVTGAITITAKAEKEIYTVTNTLTNITSNGAESATYKTAYAATLTAEEGYDLPESITVEVGETALTAGTDYTYDSATGVVTISAEKVTGNISIIATGTEEEPESYTVVSNLTNLTSNGAASATEGTAYTATLTAKEGYTLPETITVSVAGTALIVDSGYTYNSTTGKVTILAEKVTGDVLITAIGAEKEEVVVTYPYYIVAGTENLCGVTWDGSATVNQMTADGSNYVKVFSNVAAADGVQLKVVEYDSAESSGNWIGDSAGANITFNITSACDITVTYNPATQAITVTGTGVEFPSALEVESVTVTGAGTGTWLNGANWDPADETNHMTEISENVWSITYENVAKEDAGTFKFAINDDWVDNFGNEITISSSVENYDAYYNANNTTIASPYDVANITLTLDLTNFDYSTKLGAKFSVSFEEVVVEDETSTYTVVHNLTNLTSNGAQTATEGIDYTTILTAEEGYTLPSTITISVAGTAFQ